MTLPLILRTGIAILLLATGITVGAQGRTSNNVPVMFDNVGITLRNGAVLVQWSNLTERELIDYVVEKSTDAKVWEEVTRIKPKSNSNEPEHYVETDRWPAAGLSYYRIRVNEQTGRIIYSIILKIQTNLETVGISVYPNPVTTGRLGWSAANLVQGDYLISVTSFSGSTVYSQHVQIGGKAVTGTIDLPGTLPAGMYYLRLTGDAYVTGQSFIVQ